MKELYKMQKQMRDAKKKLAAIEIEAEEGDVLVVVNGAQEVVDIKFQAEGLIPANQQKLQKDTLTALKRALKKSQEVAAEEMKPLMGGLGLPGM